MANKKKLIAMSFALVIGLVTGCGTGGTVDKSSGSTGEVKSGANTPPAEIAAQFHPTIETRKENNDIILTYKVKNISGQAKKLTFPSGLQADYIVYDQNAKKVKQFSDDAVATQAIQEKTLDNNQEITKEFTISGLNGGNYKIEVFLTSKEEEAKVVTDLIIDQSSAPIKGTGEYVGQIDPHTIEINLAGNKTAFQLSDEAIDQLKSIKEGEHVTFDYSKNGNGQQVIERFDTK